MMSLIQSTASALPKRPLLRWLTPATLSASPFQVPHPRCKTTGPHHTRQINPSQLRTYTLRTKSVPSPSLQANSRSSGNLLFSSEEHVPPLDFWQSRLETLNPDDVTAEDCLYAAESYCEIAVKNNSTWKGRLQRDYGIDNYTLYTTGRCLLLAGTGPAMSLGFSMLKAGSDLGYTTSTVFLMAALVTGIRKDGTRGPMARQLFSSILPQFEQIVKSGTDPDALTLKGKMLSDQLKTNDALLYLERAIRVAAQKEKAAGSSTINKAENTALPTGNAGPPAAGAADEDTPSPIRPPRWSTEGLCYLERGRILSQMGRKKEAEKCFRVAAYELDISKAYLELAQLLANSSSSGSSNNTSTEEEREYCLLKAALSGSRTACKTLGSIEFDKANKLGSSNPQKREGHLLVANEWLNLGRDGDAIGVSEQR